MKFTLFVGVIFASILAGSGLHKVDVPAIQETYKGKEPLIIPNPNNCVDGWLRNDLYGNHCASNKFWTCADKSRILLTDEQGGKHCVKF